MRSPKVAGHNHPKSEGLPLPIWLKTFFGRLLFSLPPTHPSAGGGRVACPQHSHRGGAWREFMPPSDDSSPSTASLRSERKTLGLSDTLLGRRTLGDYDCGHQRWPGIITPSQKVFRCQFGSRPSSAACFSLCHPPTHLQVEGRGDSAARSSQGGCMA